MNEGDPVLNPRSWGNAGKTVRSLVLVMGNLG